MILPSETGPLDDWLAPYYKLGKTTAPNIAVIQAPDGGKDGPSKNVETVSILCGPCDASTFIRDCCGIFSQTSVEMWNSYLDTHVM